MHHSHTTSVTGGPCRCTTLTSLVSLEACVPSFPLGNYYTFGPSECQNVRMYVTDMSQLASVGLAQARISRGFQLAFNSTTFQSKFESTLRGGLNPDSFKSYATGSELKSSCERCYSQALPDPLPIKIRRLEDFDHVVDMVGHGWAWSGIF